MTWLAAEWHKFVVVFIWITQLLVHWEDIFDRFAGWFNITKIIERRKTVIDPLKYLKLIPVLEKLATDLEADIQSPQSQTVAADVKELIADLKGGTQ